MRILSLVFCAAMTAATMPLMAQDTVSREPVSLLQVLDSVAARYPSLEAARARIRAPARWAIRSSCTKWITSRCLGVRLHPWTAK